MDLKIMKYKSSSILVMQIAHHKSSRATETTTQADKLAYVAGPEIWSS